MAVAKKRTYLKMTNIQHHPMVNHQLEAKDSEKENSESDFGAKKPTAKAKGQKKTETKVAAKKTTVAAKQATPAAEGRKQQP